MQRTTVVAAVVAAVAFGVVGYFVGAKSGKVTMLTHPHKAKDCRGNDCDVTIKFDCGTLTVPTPCEPYAEHEVILVTHGKKIKFTIDTTTTYLFESDGIKFTSSNADSYFTCSSQAQGKKFDCDISANTPSDVYKYWIKVQGMATVDPWAVAY